MNKVDKQSLPPIRCGGALRAFKDNFYITSVLGIVHPILNGVDSLINSGAVKEERVVNRTNRLFGLITSLSGTAFLATAVFGILQAVAVHWGLIATITALLAGAGISIGSAGVVPLIMGCFLAIGFITAFLENRKRIEVEISNTAWRRSAFENSNVASPA